MTHVSGCFLCRTWPQQLKEITLLTYFCPYTTLSRFVRSRGRGKGPHRFAFQKSSKWFLLIRTAKKMTKMNGAKINLVFLLLLNQFHSTIFHLSRTMRLFCALPLLLLLLTMTSANGLQHIIICRPVILTMGAVLWATKQRQRRFREIMI